MKNILKKIIIVLTGVIIFACSTIYFIQEKLIFHPEKLNKNFTFEYKQKFEELNIEVDNNTFINGLYFKADSAKGVILYLHGNTGSLHSWGNVAEKFTYLNYDVVIIDYRGFGKSDGRIYSQKQLFNDNQTIYNWLQEKYEEKDIVLIGYSIGTGMAAYLAAKNQPGLLILKAPYYSFSDLVKQKNRFVPAYLLKYKLTTNKYIKHCQMPIILFHGVDDEVIPFNSSIRLWTENRNNTVLIKLEEQGHNNFEKNIVYLNSIKQMLTSD